jgi:membrane-bound lytic murein transglycosylase D
MMRERDRRWIRWLTVLSVETVLAIALCGQAVADPAQFPRPPQLEPDVLFWQRIYSKVTTQGGLLHDDRFLGIVYEELSFPAGMPSRDRVAMVDAARDKYEKVLRRLGSGVRDDLSADERRVLALFPPTVTDAELADAADHLRFQLGQADRFREGLLRSGTWERHVQDTLRREGLPPELSALPHVESSFNPRAYSKVGAAGLWQFMRSTGKRWLRVDNVVDERLDPYKSTLAAAQFLNINYAILGSWPLALTAYNHGAGGMRRAKEQMGTDDIVTILRNYQSRTFGFASRNFYVSFLAALEIDRNPEKFFGRIERSPADTSRTVRLPVSVSAQALEKTLGTDRETLRNLNLSLLDPVWSGRRTVPRGFELHVPAATDPQKLASKLGADEHDATPGRPASYTVRKGDTLDRIATTYGLRTAELAEFNGLADRKVRTGMTLKMPPPPAVAAPAAAPAVDTASADIYVVRAGDSLSEIARKVGLSDKALLAQNGIKDPNFLYEGQKLKVGQADATPPPAAPAADTPVDVRPRAESAHAKPQPTSREEAAANGPGLMPGIEGAASADPSDYSVTDGTAIVQGAETLGHFAEWLGVTPAHLRELNKMAAGAPLPIGRRIRLDLGTVDAAAFVERRTRFHQQMQDEFFQHYRITGQEKRRLQPGESLWSLTKRSAVPVWLLRQYNPAVDFTNMRVGTEIVLPRVEAVPAVPAEPAATGGAR